MVIADINVGLLFVFALLLIVNGVRRLVWTITAFTVAHSITLALATLGMVHVPAAPTEARVAIATTWRSSLTPRSRPTPPPA